MKSSQFNPKEPLKQRRQEPSAIHARDIEPSKFGVSQSERPRFTHDDNYSIQPQSERVFEKFVVDPIRHNPAIIKQLSLEDEIDNFPTFPLNKRNNRVNTSLKSSELNDSHRKLNNSQILNSEFYVLDNVSEPELQNIIRKICEEAYELGAAGSERKALERLEKAEQLIRKHRIEDQFKQFELIFFIFHNMTAVSYK